MGQHTHIGQNMYSYTVPCTISQYSMNLFSVLPDVSKIMYTLCVIACIHGYSMSVWMSYVAMFTIGHKDVVKIPASPCSQAAFY